MNVLLYRGVDVKGAAEILFLVIEIDLLDFLWEVLLRLPSVVAVCWRYVDLQVSYQFRLKWKLRGIRLWATIRFNVCYSLILNLLIQNGGIVIIAIKWPKAVNLYSLRFFLSRWLFFVPNLTFDTPNNFISQFFFQSDCCVISLCTIIVSNDNLFVSFWFGLCIHHNFMRKYAKLLLRVLI
jgi:hypothetical protein